MSYFRTLHRGLLLLVVALVSYAIAPAMAAGRHAASYADAPLALAIESGNNAELRRLLDEGVSPTAPQAGIPPLAVAIQANNLEAVEMLLAHPKFSGINDFYTVTIGGGTPTTERYTAIVDAILVGNAEIMQLLLDRGATVDYLYEGVAQSEPAMMTFQQTPLQLAFSTIGSYDPRAKGQPSAEEVALLFEQLQRIADLTKDVNRIITQHNAPLGVGPGNVPYKDGTEFASYPNSLFMLLSRHNNISEGNPYNEQINEVLFSIADRVDLSYKYPTFSPSAIQQLRAAGVDAATIRAAEEAQKYAYVCNTWIYTNAPLLDHVLKLGGSLDVGGDGGQLFFVSTTNAETLHTLLAHGFDINAPAYNGYRLIYGAVKGGEAFLEEVLKAGADPNLTLPDGVTNAKSFAQGLPSKERKRVVALLEEYGAK